MDLIAFCKVRIYLLINPRNLFIKHDLGFNVLFWFVFVNVAHVKLLLFFTLHHYVIFYRRVNKPYTYILISYTGMKCKSNMFF